MSVVGLVDQESHLAGNAPLYSSYIPVMTVLIRYPLFFSVDGAQCK